MLQENLLMLFLKILTEFWFKKKISCSKGMRYIKYLGFPVFCGVAPFGVRLIKASIMHMCVLTVLFRLCMLKHGASCLHYIFASFILFPGDCLFCQLLLFSC